MERRLAAILVADIVAYSAQMEHDEEGTFRLLSSRRTEIFEPEVLRHGGRVFKFTGDGFLAEFGSAVQAVECAVSIQDALAARNAGVPADRAMQARIGINLGEVIVEGDDLFGEGVNLAARLEPLAEPGGICVSDKVAREVARKLAFGFEPMGMRQMKNIAEPVQVFRVSRDAARALPLRRAGPPKHGRPRAIVAATALAAAGIVAVAVTAILYFGLSAAPPSGPPTLAVRPFTNMSGDPAQDYLGPGIADDIITLLSTSPLLRVLSKSSTFAIPPEERADSVARTLPADYVLEGSLRRKGDRFTISTQLVDGRDGRNLWSDRRDEDGTDLVAMQEAIAARVYGTLAGIRGQVAAGEVAKAWGASAPSAGEYDYHLRGAGEFLKWTDESKYKAWQIWSEGLAKYPDSALLRLELAALHNNRTIDGPSSDPWQDLQEAVRLIAEAEALPVRSRIEEWLLHYMKALTLIPAAADYEGAAREALTAHALVPYDPLSNADLSQVLANAGDTDMAVAWAEFAVKNEATVPEWYRGNLAWALLMDGRPEEAVRIFETLEYYCVACKAVALVRVGRLDDAKKEIAHNLRQFPQWSAQDVRLFPGGRNPFMIASQMEPFLADLRAAGLD
jgi:class 3 adenylate cyclase/TolB-like protein